jgi:phage tail sheath protein FI
MPDYPGVFVEEIPTLPPRVTGVDTGVAAFLGYTEKEEDPATGAALDGASLLVASMIEFERAFGGAWQGKEASPWLYDAMRLFWQNGGNRAWIASAGSFDAFEADRAKGALDPVRLRAALGRIGDLDGPALLAAPDALLMTADDYHAFAAAMLEQALARRDRFVILDVHGDPADGLALVDAFQQAIEPMGKARGFGAAYFPPLFLDSGGAPRAVPPSGAVAGAIVANDGNRGVWKAPANIQMQAIGDVSVVIDDAHQGPMNAPPNGAAVNAIRRFAGRGILIWGARTLDANDNDYRYVPVRRTMIFVEQSLKAALAPFAFEPNDAASWTKAKGMIENFLIDLWRQGALIGATPKDAFFVSVGLGSTMTAQDILDGRMIVTVGMAPARPAEFVILSLVQVMAPPG